MRSSRRSIPKKKHWFDAEEGEAHREVFDYVATVEEQQFDVYNRFVQLEVLYDPNTPVIPGVTQVGDHPGVVIENVIASNVDTVHAQIATSAVRPRVMTEDADWRATRTAKQLSWYAEQLGKKIKIHDACKKAFKSAAKKGTGVVKVFADVFSQVKAEPVRIDDLIVDEAECRNGGTPRQMHHRRVNVDRSELKAMFPEHEEKIDQAQTGKGWKQMWAGYRPVLDDELVVIESHKLPVGKKDRDGYRPGRHTICIDGCTLLDEEWHKPFFPYACVTWSEREGAFYGISLSEGIVGIQRALNKRNLQIDRNLDQYAFPTTYVDFADANLAVQTINRIGSIIPHKGQRPLTVLPQAVGGEVFQNRQDLKSAASENSGVSRMAQSAMKPAGLDSGEALRQYRDQTTQRFADQEQRFEDLELYCHWLALDACKDLGEDAPVLARKAKWGSKKVTWADVDMGDLEFQLAASSTLSQTPSGRMQTALEWAQAGVITTDEWRKLIDHPDLDRILSLYTQGMESIEYDIEAIEEGEYVTPEPFGNLALMQRMAQMAYLRDRELDGCPEEVLEALRQYAVLAADMLTQAQAPANDQMAVPPGAAMPPGISPPGQPVSALAPEAARLAG